MNNPKFGSVKKDRLFYDRFEYCLGFYLEEASCLRMLDHAGIDDLIQRRRQWREIAQQRWVNNRQQYGIILGRQVREITDQTVKDLHTVADALLTTRFEFKLVVSVNQAYVYTNDLVLIDQLDAIPELLFKTYTQAKISRPKNTVQLKKSKYKFRTYLKSLNLTAVEKDQLETFLINQQQNVRLSPALQNWVDLPFTRTQDYFFVDHETQHWTTMLSLVRSGIVRKTMHIIPTK